MTKSFIHKRHFSTLGGLLLLACFSACMDDMASGSLDQAEGCVPPFCTQTTDSVTLTLRILPPEDSGLVEQHITSVPIDSQSSFGDIYLEQPTTVTGRTYYSGETRVGVASRIVFRNLSGIADDPVVEVVGTESDGNFTIDLLPGTYSVTVSPDGELIPPFRIEELSVSGGNLIYEIPVPRPSDYFTISGTVIRAQPSETESEYDDVQQAGPLVGASVVLVSDVSGGAVSTEAQTDVEGHFSVFVPPGSRTVTIRLGPTETNELVPNLELESYLLSETTDLGDIAVEWSNPIEITGSVLGQNGETNLLAEATVFFDQTFDTGTFVQVAYADANGAFSSSVIPGDYEITVVPPSDAEYGAATTQLNLEENSQVDLVSTRKHALFGFLDLPTADSPENISICSEPTGFSVSSISLSQSCTTTDTSGAYLLYVHPGTQRITIVAPDTMGVAPRMADINTINEDIQLSIELELAYVAEGRVLSPDGQPVDDALIDVYVDLNGTLVLFNTLTTNSDGEFSVNVPALTL